MKRFHVHVCVPDLDQSIAFYNKLFGAEPSVHKADYAKWMLDDPRVNFAISARGTTTGVNHLGFQLESDTALGQFRQQAEAADLSVVAETGAGCCYAKSDKYWIQDPAGIAWETFHTLAEIPVFGQTPDLQSASSPGAGICCPRPSEKASAARVCCA